MTKKLKALSMVCFLLPILTVIISYILSIKYNLVDSCIPNLEGCTSISRVGRYEPVKYLFKPLMYLYCLFLILYWHNYFKILKKKRVESKLIYWMTLLSIIFLALYITFLGESKVYSFFKKIGIYIYILFIVLSQFFESKLLIKNFNKFKNTFFEKFVLLKYYLSSFMIIFGLILLPILIVKIDNFPGIKNIISWNYFLLVQLYFFLVFLSLRSN